MSAPNESAIHAYAHAAWGIPAGENCVFTPSELDIAAYAVAREEKLREMVLGWDAVAKLTRKYGSGPSGLVAETIEDCAQQISALIGPKHD